MALDFSAGCVNFRDVGEWINLIAGQPVMREERLFRGGKLDHVQAGAGIGSPGTVLNLRRGPDREAWLFGADALHLPARDGVENYDTAQPQVRRWLGAVARAVAAPETRLPLLLHCTSGKDRTGVAVAALLALLGMRREWIVEEYLLSEGEVRRAWIGRALDGLGDATASFSGVDRAALQRRLLTAES